jgi:hypothetical protein
MRKGNGRVNTKPLTERREKYSAYQLAPKEVSAILQAELTELYQFLTEMEWPGRLSNPITASSAETYLKHLRLILGWLHRYQGTPVSELSLNLLVPKITAEELEDLSDSEKEKFWKQHQYNLETCISNYFKFLRETMGSFSPRTKKFKMNALSALAKFQYHTEVEHPNDYKNIPLIKVINKYSRAVRKEIKQWERQKRYTIKPENKWPEVIDTKTALSTVRLQILEPLRQECRVKYDNWHWRDSSALAMSIQRYLAWSFLADMPARRQEEYRSLRVALSCSIKRPSEVPLNEVYHPLPPADVRQRRRDKNLEDNYIYKTYFYKNTYYKSGVWVLDLQNYKTWKTYGSQSIAIPNRKFSDGNCLYDYIERHLYGWYLNEDYGQQGKWLTAGRTSFNPGDACYIYNQSQNSEFWSWGYFFIQPLVGLPFNSTEFKDLVRNAAHRLTGIGLTPHTMRSIWATWAYQVGLTDSETESLAYAMGHDVKILLELYEKCTPDEKRRPIEEAIDELLFSTLRAVQKSGVELEQLAQKVLQLPADELQQVMELLNQ